MDFLIQKAKIKNIKGIYSLINRYTEFGEILPRSLSELYDQLRDFFVCLDGNQGSQLIGTCAMHICWEDIAEIRSLIVAPEYQGKKLGSKLVEACLSEAVVLGIYKIFVLTYKPKFFEKFGFKQVDKNVLPHKVWADCIKCVKFPDCHEIAMVLNL